MQNTALQGNQLLPGLLSTAQQRIAGGGLSDEQRSGLDPLKNIASGQNAISVVQPGEANPYLMDVLDTAANRASSSMQTAFGGIGRGGGGGAPTGMIGREVGDIYTRGLAGQMNTDLDRR